MATPARPIFMPETYTGVGREWTDWAAQFEMAADVNEWNAALKLKFMSLLLSGRAREVYSGLSAADKADYEALKTAMGRCLDPSDSDDWNRATFSSRKRLHNETVREFGIALRRLVTKAYPTADANTHDMLAKDHFIANVGSGDLRVSLRSAKPPTLEAAITLAAELELIRGLEGGSMALDAKVRGVAEKPAHDEKITSLLGVVESLRQEVKSLQITVQSLANSSKPAPMATPTESAQSNNPRPQFNRSSTDRGGACWICNCNRHQRKDCPYQQSN